MYKKRVIDGSFKTHKCRYTVAENKWVKDRTSWMFPVLLRNMLKNHKKKINKYGVWACLQEWNLPLEMKIVKSHWGAHKSILNIFVYLLMCTWRARSIFLQALNVKHVAALMSMNLWCRINSSITSYLTELKLWKVFFCCTYENQSVYLVKCVDQGQSDSFSQSVLLSPSPGNPVWMGLIKPSCSMTPDKDSYFEFALEFSLTTRKMYILAFYGNKSAIEKWETWWKRKGNKKKRSIQVTKDNLHGYCGKLKSSGIY